MSIVKINALHVPAGQGNELERRFAARAQMVDGEPGFEGFTLLRPVKGDHRYFVMTVWESQESFDAWRAKTAKKVPVADNRKPVATGADLLEFEVVDLL